MKLVVTGRAGFIDSAFVRGALATHLDVEILYLHELTYTANLENVTSVEGPRYRFITADVCNSEAITTALQEFAPDAVHFAAESHRRYTISSEKLRRDTGSVPRYTIEQWPTETVARCSANREWVRRVQSHSDMEYCERRYSGRASHAQIEASSPGGNLLPLS